MNGMEIARDFSATIQIVTVTEAVLAPSPFMLLAKNGSPRTQQEAIRSGKTWSRNVLAWRRVNDIFERIGHAVGAHACQHCAQSV